MSTPRVGCVADTGGSMPKAYVVFTEDIRDQDGMGAYSQKAMPTIAQSGAKVLVASEEAEVLEGDWHGSRTVILEFESPEAARSWYDSPEYQAAIPLRQAVAAANAVILPGL